MRYAGTASVFVLFALSACSTILTPTFGVREGQLAVCPTNRDCLSTQDNNADLYIAPLVYTSSHAQARSDLLTAVNAVGQSRIVSNHRNYIRIEYPIVSRSEHASEYYYQPENAVDDVEFYLDPERRIIEMRSIARPGLFDVGANRARLEQIRGAFNKLQQSHQ